MPLTEGDSGYKRSVMTFSLILTLVALQLLPSALASPEATAALSDVWLDGQLQGQSRLRSCLAAELRKLPGGSPGASVDAGVYQVVGPRPASVNTRDPNGLGPHFEPRKIELVFKLDNFWRGRIEQIRIRLETRDTRWTPFSREALGGFRVDGYRANQVLERAEVLDVTGRRLGALNLTPCRDYFGKP